MGVTGERKRSRHSRLLLMSLLALGAVLLWGAGSLVYPFGRDQAEYATIAMEAGRGKVVYRDIFSVKPPLTHMAHGLALHIFGHSMLAIRLLDLLWQGMTAVLLALLAEQVFHRRLVGVLAALFYAIGYYSLSFWHTAQTDGFLSLPIAFSVLLYGHYRRSRRMYWLVGCGAMIGIAVWFKYPIGVLFPLLVLWILFGRQPARWRAALALTVGFGLPIVLFLFLLILQGALRDFVLILTRYVPVYNASLGDDPYLYPVVGFFSLLYMQPYMMVSFLAAIVGSILRRRALFHWAEGVLPCWLAAVIHLFVQNKFYAYHGVPLLAPGAILTAYLLVVAQGRLGSTRWARWAFGSILAVVVLGSSIGLGYPARQARLLNVVTGRATLPEVYAGFGPYGEGDYSVRADLEVAAYLRAHTSPEDSLFIWGFEPTVYFLAERRLASRFLYNFPLYGAFAQPQFRQQLLAELGQSQPLYMLVVQNDAMPPVTRTDDDSWTALHSFPALADLLSREYALERQIEDFRLYRRRSKVDEYYDLTSGLHFVTEGATMASAFCERR